MWHWDQGHLAYFQFDSLRRIAAFVVGNDFKSASRAELLAKTGLEFAAPASHAPWRQYARVLRATLLVSEVGNSALATPVAHVLAIPGGVTCDEYLHFIVRSFSEPSPSFKAWSAATPVRYPLLFALKYVLAKLAVTGEGQSNLDEVIGAYALTGFTGDEDDTAFIGAIARRHTFEEAAGQTPENLGRQARESLRVIAQISYLHLEDSIISVSLDKVDAHNVFADMHAITGPRALDRNAEIRRLADLFKDGATEDFYDYPNTVINDVVQSGFPEGTKVQRTHLVIERNKELRRAYFAAHPSDLCDVCLLDTAATYPWTTRVLDLHHLLPLASGTRVEKTGTSFDDLVPVCPSCHRAVHRFYDQWLASAALADFSSEQQARETYFALKSQFGGAVHHA